jgi:hypothetical protein
MAELDHLEEWTRLATCSNVPPDRQPLELEQDRKSNRERHLTARVGTAFDAITSTGCRKGGKEGRV